MEKEYRYCSDPKTSCMILAEQSSNVHLIWKQESSFETGVITTVGKDLLDRFTAVETFADSTYKTNAQKLELFCVLVTYSGCEVPVAYFYSNHVLLTLTSRYFVKKYSIPSFFPVLREHLHRF